MDYKTETIKVYDKFPEYFDEKFGFYVNKFLKDRLEKMASLLPQDAKILDLGAGPGNLALLLKQKGFDILCADISNEMIKKCKEKNLRATIMDIEEISCPPDTFDCVVAYTSLLHIPKSKVPNMSRTHH